VDAITGATQTSTALMRFLNQELAAVRSLDLNPEIDHKASTARLHLDQ